MCWLFAYEDWKGYLQSINARDGWSNFISWCLIRLYVYVQFFYPALFVNVTTLKKRVKCYNINKKSNICLSLFLFAPLSFLELWSVLASPIIIELCPSLVLILGRIRHFYWTFHCLQADGSRISLNCKWIALCTSQFYHCHTTFQYFYNTSSCCCWVHWRS